MQHFDQHVTLRIAGSSGRSNPRNPQVPLLGDDAPLNSLFTKGHRRRALTLRIPVPTLVCTHPCRASFHGIGVAPLTHARRVHPSDRRQLLPAGCFHRLHTHAR